MLRTASSGLVQALMKVSSDTQMISEKVKTPQWANSLESSGLWLSSIHITQPPTQTQEM